ncbi:MAG: hypothetical protein JRI95_08830 [Deltaproteobacteria bacterium]|nr:hypothetical protein [Deltaproteobacteria bacterium]MBW2085734.1 hypothetical protein [Deltaproteobacteria bacterium]
MPGICLAAFFLARPDFMLDIRDEMNKLPIDQRFNHEIRFIINQELSRGSYRLPGVGWILA